MCECAYRKTKAMTIWRRRLVHGTENKRRRRVNINEMNWSSVKWRYKLNSDFVYLLSQAFAWTPGNCWTDNDDVSKKTYPPVIDRKRREMEWKENMYKSIAGS